MRMVTSQVPEPLGSSGQTLESEKEADILCES
jgi:hypothetical protein